MGTDFKLSHIPHLLAVLIGFTYISGYLIDFFYFTSRGVSDVGGELFKLRYIHVGIYFDLTLALFVATPIFMLLHFFPTTETAEEKPSSYLQVPSNNWMILVPLLYQFSLFAPTILAPNDFFSRPEHPERYWDIFWLILLVSGVYWAGAYSINCLLNSKNEQRNTTILAFLLMGIMAVFNRNTAPALWPTVAAMFPNLLLYILFCLVLSANITVAVVASSKANSRRENSHDPNRNLIAARLSR